MNKLLLSFLLSAATAHAEDCNCRIYPFTPNPPCFHNCVNMLVKNRGISLKSIKGIDPGVAVSISALRTQDYATFTEFSGITNKETLEGEAVKIIPDTGGSMY